MPWVRIHDGALTHPKVVGLIDWKSPFCLWVWGLSYCQQHLTDGFIPSEAMPTAMARKTAAQLVARGLWDDTVTGGYVVHDYLQWNDPKASVLKKREALRERVTRYRRADTPRDRNASATSGVVYSTDLSSTEDPEGVQGKPPDPERRAEPDRRVTPRRGGDYGRIFLHRWQLDALIASLGIHADGFNLDVFLDALSNLADAQGVTFPSDKVRWAWVQAQLASEVRRRCLPVATVEEPPTNKRIAGLMAGGQAFLNRTRRQA